LCEGKQKIAVSLRSWIGEEEYLPVLADVLQKLRSKFPVQYVFFPFQYGCDEEVSRRVLDLLTQQGNGVDSGDCIVSGRHTPEQVAAMLKEMDGVLAMRLHAVILSALSCVPAFGLIYDLKVQSFMERAGLGGHFIAIEDMAGNEEVLLQALTNWLLQKNKISEQMEPRIKQMVAMTQRNAQIIKELLKD
jgi:polysaccharide pyruvyl transferase WcaK-like protein